MKNLPKISTVCILVLVAFTLMVRDIKGNGSSMIYHLPSCYSYPSVNMANHPDDKWFFTAKQAESAGFRKANNCK